MAEKHSVIVTVQSLCCEILGGEVGEDVKR